MGQAWVRHVSGMGGTLRPTADEAMTARRRPVGANDRIARARLRHERARLDRSDRRFTGPVDRPAHAESLHADRLHGDRDDNGDADDAALVTQAAAVAQERTPAA